MPIFWLVFFVPFLRRLISTVKNKRGKKEKGENFRVTSVELALSRLPCRTGWSFRIGILNRLDNASGDTPGNAERRNVPSHDRPRADGGALPDRYTREDGGSDSDPTVVADGNGFGIDFEIPAALDIFIVVLGDDGHVGAEQDAVSDGDDCAVHDAKTVCGNVRTNHVS